jgi:hypothetical protein
MDDTHSPNKGMRPGHCKITAPIEEEEEELGDIQDPSFG